MICKIADLITEIPDAGDMPSRCRDYIYDGCGRADITVRYENYPFHKHPGVPEDIVIYMSSGVQFYKQLLELGGMMLHSSAVEYEGRAYLFSGPSGMGKSTHTAIWTRVFDSARVINDDKPALRYIDGKWYVYGTPWSGKTRQNINTRAPLAGICFLGRAESNSIRTMPSKEALINIIAQTTRKKLDTDKMNCLLVTVEKLLSHIPVYEMKCLPDEDAARLSYKTMSAGAKEIDV